MSMPHFSRFYILICFLLWSLHSNIADIVNNTIGDERISLIRSEQLKLQSDILTLSTSLELGDDNYHDLKLRLSTLEREFQSLRAQLHDESRESTAANRNYDASITVLTNYHNSLDTQLKALQKSMERKLQADVAEGIRNHRFSVAKSLLQIANNEQITKIVHDVYENSQGNADVLLEFAKNETKGEVSFYVLVALRDAMRTNGNNDSHKMISLVDTLERKVINRRRVSSDMKSKAQAVLNETYSDIKTAATETLKDAMLSDNYQTNLQMIILINAVFDFSWELSDEVMKGVVNETYPALSAVKIADNIYNSNSYVKPKVTGLVALFWKLDSANDLNNQGVLRIGYYLKLIMEHRFWRGYSKSRKAAVNSVIEKMPACAKNMFFASSVCIWNKGKSEYLYAESWQFNFRRDRRSIFTWGTGKPINQGIWYVEKFGDNFCFKNKAHGNEYLYAAGVNTYDREKRRVLTWITGGHVGNKSAWNVELNGDYCYLRNQEYNEYLFTSNLWRKENRRYVFTWIPRTTVQQDDFQWQIRNCTKISN